MNSNKIAAIKGGMDAAATASRLTPEELEAKARRLAQQAENVRIGDGDHLPIVPEMTLDEMIEGLALIANGQQVVPLHARGFPLTVQEFKSKMIRSKTPVTVTTPDGPKITHVSTVKLWMENAGRQSADTFTFAPGRPRFTAPPSNQGIALNTYFERPHAAPKDWQHAVAPFVNHVEYLIPEPGERERFLDWIAHIEQRPEVLPHYWVLMIASIQGIGRNLLASILTRVFAGHTAAGFDLGHTLRTGFNGGVAGKLLAITDELRVTLDAGGQVQQRLKSFTTEEVRNINPKYGREYQEFNCMRLLAFSNHLDAIPIDDADRRCMVILNPSERHPEGAAYYTRMFTLRDDPSFIASVREYLRRRDMSGFNPGEHAPMTNAKKVLIESTKSDAVKAIEHVRDNWESDVIDATTLQLEVRIALGGDRLPLGRAWNSALADAQVRPYGGMNGDARKVRIKDKAVRAYILRNGIKWQGAQPHVIGVEIEKGLPKPPVA